jgi:hypothetical protein
MQDPTIAARAEPTTTNHEIVLRLGLALNSLNVNEAPYLNPTRY